MKNRLLFCLLGLAMVSAACAQEQSLGDVARARTLFLHDTSHRCQQESSGNSGPDWNGSETFEVAAADRMRFVFQEGSRQGEWLFVEDSYYQKAGGSWRKSTSPQEVNDGRITFPAALIPLALKFGFQEGDLKSQGDQVIQGVATVLYRSTIHTYEMDRTVDLWIGKADSLPYRIDMRTETKERHTRPVISGESTTCKYGVEIKIEPPI